MQFTNAFDPKAKVDKAFTKDSLTFANLTECVPKVAYPDQILVLYSVSYSKDL